MSDKDKIAEIVKEDKIEYPVSCEQQEKLWDECWKQSQERGYEYTYTLAMTQSLFAYRIGVLADRILDRDLREMNDEELNELLEKKS